MRPGRFQNPSKIINNMTWGASGGVSGARLFQERRSELVLMLCLRLLAPIGRVWSHANISRDRKLEILKSLIESKVCYGLGAMWLGATEQRKIDGFQSYCLRRILRIPPSFISRVSHDEVLRRAGQERLSKTIIRGQLMYFGKVAMSPPDSLQRKATFHDFSLTPKTAAFVRRVGRPRHTWAEQLLELAINQTREDLHKLLESPKAWRNLCVQYT